MLNIVNPVISPIIGEHPSIDPANRFVFPIFGTIISNFISIILGLAGVVSFFMLLWGGVQYITAGGDKERTQGAMKRITSALIGLAIVFSVFAILYVVETLFGVSIRTFTIPVIQ